MQMLRGKWWAARGHYRIEAPPHGSRAKSVPNDALGVGWPTPWVGHPGAYRLALGPESSQRLHRPGERAKKLEQARRGRVTGGGSQLVLREFGTHQCLAIFLDGVSLPDEVYAELDFESVVTQPQR